MINPAQYTKVLQAASDQQLMDMLKRPDKIPSQFIVAEINRRQAMRQAAQAQERKMASMQQQPVMPQAPQQMAPQGRQQPQRPPQQPVGMRVGGDPNRIAQMIRERPYMVDDLVYRQPSKDISNMDFSGLRQNLPYVYPNPEKGLKGLGSEDFSKFRIPASLNEGQTSNTLSSMSEGLNNPGMNEGQPSNTKPIGDSDSRFDGPKTIDQKINDGFESFEKDLESTKEGIKSSGSDVTAAEIDKKGIKSKKITIGKTTGETDTSELEKSIEDKVTVDLGEKSQTALFKEVFEAQNADRLMQAEAQAVLSENQRKRLSGLQADYDKVSTAMEELAKVYDKNSTTPENRFFRSLTDMGVDLLASPEANFMQALGKSAKKGLETWDTLSKEAKDNVLKKYTAGVTLAQTRADLNSKIINAANAIDKGDVDALNSILTGKMADRRGLIDAGAQDKGFSLKGTGLELQGRGQDISAAGQLAQTRLGDTRIKSQEEIAQGQISSSQAEGDANRSVRTETAQAQLDQGADIANQRDERAKQGQLIQVEGLELQSLNNWASQLNADERNRIANITANKPPAAVAYLEHLVSNKTKYGLDDSDITDFITGANKGTSGSMASILTTVRTYAETDFKQQTPIPGVEPANNGEYSLSQYDAYHRRNLLGIFGLGGDQSLTSRNAPPKGTRVYDEDGLADKDTAS